MRKKKLNGKSVFSSSSAHILVYICVGRLMYCCAKARHMYNRGKTGKHLRSFFVQMVSISYYCCRSCSFNLMPLTIIFLYAIFASDVSLGYADILFNLNYTIKLCVLEYMWYVYHAFTVSITSTRKFNFAELQTCLGKTRGLTLLIFWVPSSTRPCQPLKFTIVALSSVLLSIKFVLQQQEHRRDKQCVLWIFMDF